MEFRGVFVLAVEFPKDVTQFCRISRGAFGLSGISRGKVKKQKIPENFQKGMSSTPPVFFFFLE